MTKSFLRRVTLAFGIALGEAEISQGKIDLRIAGNVRVGAVEIIFRARQIVRFQGQPAGVVADSGPKRRIGPGKAQYTMCCDESGGVVDDLIQYVRAEDDVFLIPNAANTTAVSPHRSSRSHGSRSRAISR